MHVRNFIELVRVILVIDKHCLYYDKFRLIRNDPDQNVFLEFSMHVRNFIGLVRVILVIYTLLLYYYMHRLIRNDQDHGNDLEYIIDILKNIIKP